VIAIAGLLAGTATGWNGHSGVASLIWRGATAPVLAALTFSILRDFWRGRIGVDAVALVSMSAALVLDEPLAAIVVAIMYSGGNVLEDFARGRAQRDLKALADRAPRAARRKVDDGFTEIPVTEVTVGEELLVRAGEVLPVDGILLDVFASIDESAVTGEPLPVPRRSGDLLKSGTVNAGEAFRFRASAVADESTYATIVRLVEAAQNAKAPFIRMADRFALFLLPATLIVAGLAWLVSGDPIRALAVLVVSTPCPLILAAPVAFIGGVSRAARYGVLMKGSSALEALSQVKTAIFDKTGTLTQGGARLVQIETAPGIDADAALTLLASLEQASPHALADAIVKAAREKDLSLSWPEQVVEHRGAGVEGLVQRTKIRAGSRELVFGDSQLPIWAQKCVSRYGKESVLTIYLQIDTRPAAVVIFGDGLRADARGALARLRAAGITRFIMLTGDDAQAAGAIAAALPLDGVLADCSPSEKVAAVATEKNRAPTMMVGDGINDAPALAAATVGVAMGARGATASSEAAEVVILTDGLEPLADAVAIAHHTHGIAMQSIVFGLALSGVAMGFAAAGMITPVAGALLQEGIDIAVIVNALRALGGDPRESILNGRLGFRPSHQTAT
jgi:heavy metal translocating P-type ATPase